eukprot:jgi/Chrzof1/9060/Cz03g34180.t1
MRLHCLHQHAWGHWSIYLDSLRASPNLCFGCCCCCCCCSDVCMCKNEWGITSYPLIAGHEVVGVVGAVGESVKGVKVGDRVGVGWIRDSCRGCPNCIRGMENLCTKGYTGTIVGPGNFGGFQQRMRAPADFVYKIPDKLGSAEAAPLLCAGLTVYAPLRKHITKANQKVAIVGVGGLGHLAIQYANKMGAQVTGIDIDATKEAEANQLGAHNFTLFDNALENNTASFDLIVNCASGRLDWPKVLNLLKPDGTVVQLGIPGGGVQINLPLQDLVFGQKKFAGSIVGGRADMQDMLQFSADQGIKPMIELTKLSKVNEAIERMHQGKPRYRIVMETDI